MNQTTENNKDKDTHTSSGESGSAGKSNASGNSDNSDKSDKSDRSDKSDKFNWKKWLIAASIALVVVVIAAMLLWPKSIEVEVATVQNGPVTVTVEEQGRTRTRFPYTVAAPISGRLLRPTLKEGDQVERGQIVARIAPPPSDARTKATTRAELAAAQARQRDAAATRTAAASALRLAKTEAARRTELYRSGMVSAEGRDSYVQAAQAASDKLGSADASLAAARAEVDAARARLLGANIQPGGEGAIPIRAPVDGIVLHVLEKSERVVPSGTPLFDLSRGDAIELIIDVLSEQGVQVRGGDPIRITGWGGGNTLMGKVRYFEPGAFTNVSALGVEEQRVNVIGDLNERPATLGVEFRVEAAIVTWSGKVLRIPTGAMFRRDDAWQVFAVEDGKARLRKVEIGHRGNDFAEVTSGLKQGDKVIVFPSDQIEDGVRVNYPSNNKTDAGP
ncbi:MAG: efflux RND transporter periplasmic adaptor subunit [Burkholderiaceae bacterium]